MLACADKAWLTIGIPTVPRKSGADYLTRTLSTMMEELPLDSTDPLFKRVRVLVMNNRPGNHTVFYKVCAFPPQACGMPGSRDAADLGVTGMPACQHPQQRLPQPSVP